MADIVAGITGFMRHSWNLIAGCYIPGTSISIGHMLVGLALIGLGWNFLSLILKINIGSSDSGSSGSDYGSGSNKNIRINNKRRGDDR